MHKKSTWKAASGVLPLVVDLRCGYIYVREGLFADRARRLPLVAICTAWRADQVLYGSCPIGIYSDDVVLCVFLALGVEVGSRNSVQYSGSIELCMLL